MRSCLALVGLCCACLVATPGLAPITAADRQAGAPLSVPGASLRVLTATAGAPNLRATFSADGQNIDLTLAGAEPRLPFLLSQVPASDTKALGVELLVVEGGKIKRYTYDLALSPRSGPAPNPTPTPDPPKPDPKPAPASWTWAIVLEESQDRTPEVTRLLTSKAVRNACTGAGRYPLQRVERDQAGPFQSFADWAAQKKATLPYLMLSNDAGTIVWDGPLPTTEAALLQILGAKQ